MIFYNYKVFDFKFPTHKNTLYNKEAFEKGYFTINGKNYKEYNTEFKEALAAEQLWERLKC